MPAVEAGNENVALTEHEQEMLRRSAVFCVDNMKHGPPPWMMEQNTPYELDHIAAALALMCGRFVFSDGKPNPTAAARAMGHTISRPSMITSWVDKLERLDAKLEQMYARRLKRFDPHCDVWESSDPDGKAAYIARMDMRASAMLRLGAVPAEFSRCGRPLHENDADSERRRRYHTRPRDDDGIQAAIREEMEMLYARPDLLQVAREVLQAGGRQKRPWAYFGDE